MTEGARDLSGVFFTRALIPFIRAPSLRPKHLPRPPSPVTITLGIRFQHVDWGQEQPLSLLQVRTSKRRESRVKGRFPKDQEHRLRKKE